MDLSISNADAITIVSFPDTDLDTNNVRDFKETIKPFLTKEAKLIFDMTRLQSIDSSGLGAIMSCLRSLEIAGGVLKLCGLSEENQALFELVRMDKILEIYMTQEGAVQSFQV